VNANYIRLECNHNALKKRRDRLNAAAEKNSDLHENARIKPVYGLLEIREGIRVAKAINWYDAKRGLVYRIDNTIYDPTTTPSHDINQLIQHFPEKVSATNTCNEDGSPIPLPFSLPLYWRLSNQKYLSEIVKPYFYQFALAEQETLSQEHYRLTPFTFTLSRSLVESMQGQKREMVDYLRDRIQKRVNEALQRPKDNQVSFWFALEMARRGQPHIQGSMLLALHEQEIVRQALYKLNGGAKMTPEEKHGALRFGLTKREELFLKRGRLYTDLNWADYNLKERSTTRRDYNNLRPVVAVSQPLIRQTKDYYNRLRKEFNRQQRAVKKPINHLFGSW
jgi:hypothetical protein